MDPTVKTEWLAALRSGDYKQGRRALNKDGEFCCLGVLCDLAVKAGKTVAEKFDEDEADYTYYGQYRSTSFLPQEVAGWAKISHRGHLPTPVDAPGRYPEDGQARTLAEANDRGMTFAEIADIIEEQF